MAMKGIHRFLIVILLTLLVSGAFFGTSSAQTDEAAALYTKMAELYRAGKYSEALPYAQRGLAIMEQRFGPDHPNVARSLNNLAALYSELGRRAALQAGAGDQREDAGS